jgi:hypothetical protein
MYIPGEPPPIKDIVWCIGSNTKVLAATSLAVATILSASKSIAVPVTLQTPVSTLNLYNGDPILLQHLATCCGSTSSSSRRANKLEPRQIDIMLHRQKAVAEEQISAGQVRAKGLQEDVGAGRRPVEVTATPLDSVGRPN